MINNLFTGLLGRKLNYGPEGSLLPEGAIIVIYPGITILIKLISLPSADEVHVLYDYSKPYLELRNADAFE